jgi:hypothetical protein
MTDRGEEGETLGEEHIRNVPLRVARMPSAPRYHERARYHEHAWYGGRWSRGWSEAVARTRTKHRNATAPDGVPVVKRRQVGGVLKADRGWGGGQVEDQCRQSRADRCEAAFSSTRTEEKLIWWPATAAWLSAKL